MKKLYRNIFFLIITFICLSCDPNHSIEFINHSDSELKVKFKLDTTISNYDLDYTENKKGDSIIFNINQKDTAILDFGIGTWSDSEIRKQVKSFCFIEIENSDVKKTFKSKREMEKFLTKNKEGLLGLKIIIEIE